MMVVVVMAVVIVEVEVVVEYSGTNGEKGFKFTTTLQCLSSLPCTPSVTAMWMTALLTTINASAAKTTVATFRGWLSKVRTQASYTAKELSPPLFMKALRRDTSRTDLCIGGYREKPSHGTSRDFQASSCMSSMTSSSFGDEQKKSHDRILRYFLAPADGVFGDDCCLCCSAYLRDALKPFDTPALPLELAAAPLPLPLELAALVLEVAAPPLEVELAELPLGLGLAGLPLDLGLAALPVPLGLAASLVGLKLCTPAGVTYPHLAGLPDRGESTPPAKRRCPAW